MNWYIGQRVVAVKNTDATQKGQEYIIQDIQTCACGSVSFNVGVLSECHKWRCGCKRSVDGLKNWYLNERLFAPLDEKPELSEFTNETIIESIEPVYI
jgi:hypothetical protein